MSIEEKIKVLQASLERKTIQWKSKVDNYMGWEDMTPLMDFNFGTADYRIKPEAKVRPYTFEEMCEAVKKHGAFVRFLEGIVFSILWVDTVELKVGDDEMSYQELLDDGYVWLDDNSPCGIVEE